MHRQTSSIWGLHPLARRETRRTLGPGQRIDTHSLSKCVSTCAHHRFVSECVSGEASEVPVASGRRPPGCAQHRSLAVSVNRSSRQLGKHDLQFTDTDKERWFGRGRRLSSRPKSRASDADAPELLRSNCHACRTILGGGTMDKKAETCGLPQPSGGGHPRKEGIQRAATGR